MKKNNQKLYIYPFVGVLLVIIIFAILSLWSIGDFENYKKISKFKDGILSKDFKFKKFPPDELFGLKLYDDFEKYLLVNKSEIRIDEVNNTKYYDIYNPEKKIKFTNPFPEYFDEFEFYVKENGEISSLAGGHEIRLDNNNNILNFCTKTRDSFFRQHSLTKLNFKSEYYWIDDDGFLDFKNFDFKINNKSTRFQIGCFYEIKEKSIRYLFVLFLIDVSLWKDLKKEYDLRITSKKISNTDIKKFRDKKKKKQ